MMSASLRLVLFLLAAYGAVMFWNRWIQKRSKPACSSPRDVRDARLAFQRRREKDVTPHG